MIVRQGTVAFAVLLAACNPNSGEPEADPSQAASEVQTAAPLATPTPATTAAERPQSPPPVKDANGCVELQLPGSYTGKDLGKTFVPGPVVKMCDPPRIEAAPAASPLAPVATVPAAMPQAPIATPQ